MSPSRDAFKPLFQRCTLTNTGKATKCHHSSTTLTISLILSTVALTCSISVCSSTAVCLDNRSDIFRDTARTRGCLCPIRPYSVLESTFRKCKCYEVSVLLVCFVLFWSVFRRSPWPWTDPGHIGGLGQGLALELTKRHRGSPDRGHQRQSLLSVCVWLSCPEYDFRSLPFLRLCFVSASPSSGADRPTSDQHALAL